MGRILLCDDEMKLTRMLGAALTGAGHSAERVATGGEAVDACIREAFDVLVTDLRLPDMDGLEVLRRARELRPEMDVIMITAHATTETAVEAMRRGAHDYLIKPFSIDEFRIKINNLLQKRDLRQKNADLQDQLDAIHRPENLVGTSARMREVFDQVRQVARTDSTVLLLGESGTGKTLLARSIHHQSRRASGPLCEVHCAALPEALLEAELFGHERGAFTGAVGERVGHVERSHKGTLFLDEIGEISTSIQVKLLRFIQDRHFFRVGGTQVRQVDVRFVVATNRDLAQAVRERSFREDFYYRINVFPIHVPSLRERTDDIPALAMSILRRRGPHVHLADDAMEMLTKYPWPGNVRELENVLERAVILAGTNLTEDGHLTIQARHLPKSLSTTHSMVSAASVLTPGFSIDRFERELILEAISRASGNKTEAARLLGITRRRLYSRLKSMEDKEAKLARFEAAELAEVGEAEAQDGPDEKDHPEVPEVPELPRDPKLRP